MALLAGSQVSDHCPFGYLFQISLKILPSLTRFQSTAYDMHDIRRAVVSYRRQNVLYALVNCLGNLANEQCGLVTDCIQNEKQNVTS